MKCKGEPVEKILFEKEIEFENQKMSFKISKYVCEGECIIPNNEDKCLPEMKPTDLYFDFDDTIFEIGAVFKFLNIFKELNNIILKEKTKQLDEIMNFLLNDPSLPRKMREYHIKYGTLSLEDLKRFIGGK